ncbi:hypothetical protein [Streptomyces sp. RKCA744]|uniref:hypothetical protein n=1 Tax=Streptomyces sp. RKCA744 TaxID=2959340 RepID=UPI00209D0E83|nr:hypothetical protein [Streptomyces sp. RKCA744]MCO8303591.1 hypothetical protein [Streptomyces sp. RKCA744]
MTTAIMTRSAARTTEAAVNPEYACDRCGGWHSGTCPAAAHRQLGDLLARMVREADTRIPDGRRARRTLQEMMPGYERQPVLTLHRPAMADMADDACPLCGRWACTGSDCPPSSTVPTATPATASGGGQCSRCGGWFPDWNGGVCDACR